jgi:hypothetical protein
MPAYWFLVQQSWYRIVYYQDSKNGRFDLKIGIPGVSINSKVCNVGQDSSVQYSPLYHRWLVLHFSSGRRDDTPSRVKISLNLNFDFDFNKNSNNHHSFCHCTSRATALVVRLAQSGRTNGLSTHPDNHRRCQVSGCCTTWLSCWFISERSQM